MATVYPTTDIVASGTAISDGTTPGLADTDTLLVDKDIAIISTGSYAVNLSNLSTASVENYGLIAGDSRGITAISSTSAVTYSVYNGATGTISATGDGNTYAIALGGNSLASAGSTFTVINDGQISGGGSGTNGGMLLYYAETATVANNGTISGFATGSGYYAGPVTFYGIGTANFANAGIVNSAADSGAVRFQTNTATVNFTNSGTINAVGRAIQSEATTAETIINSGTLNGDVVLSDTVGALVRNSGEIFGDVDLQGGADNFANYLNGFVSGTVLGGAGNDTLIGGNAGDVLDGGADADFMRGRLGDDTLIGGSENDRLYGEEGNDRLQGDAGNDTIFGGAGEDVIVGGNGLDVLFGGADADTFVYNTFADSQEGGLFDRIRDFTPGEDKINLTGVASGIDFVTSFTGTGPEVRAFLTSAGLQLVQVDYNGDGVADMRIALLGTTELVTENDFIL